MIAALLLGLDTGLLVDVARETFELAAETAPFLFVGFFAAGLLKVFVPTQFVESHLGGEGLGAITKASLFGVPLPLCSCSVIPTAAGLRDAGAGRGPTAAFLISTPETGVDSISVTWGLLDPVMTVARPVVSFLTAVITGVLVALFGGPEPEPEPLPESCCAPETEPDPCCASASAGDRPRGKLRQILRYGFVTLIDDLALWLLIGFVLSGLVAALVPASFFTDTVPTGLWGMLLMMAVGTPLYICATSSTPIAAALVAKGLAPGAALVFLLVGPATNATTLLVVSRMIGRRGVALYLAGIIGSALAAGFFVDWLYAVLEIDLTAHVSELMAHEPSLLAKLAGALLIVLLVASLVRQRRAGEAH
jgi:uncharacterized membrane protein YraQ (UPF0718 family)